MSLKNKLISMFTVAVSVAALSAFSFGQDAKPAAPADGSSDQVENGMRGKGRHSGKGRQFGKGKHHGGMMRGLKALNLTDAQKAQFKAIREANKPSPAEMEEMRAIRKAKQDGTITAGQTERLTAMKAERKAKGESIRTQIQAILTPEQKAQVEQKKLEMKKHREERKLKRQQTPTAAAPAQVS